MNHKANSKARILGLVSAWGLIFSSAAYAEEQIEGLVRVVGHAASPKVVLTKADEKDGPALCASELSKRVSKLSGMTVSVKGNWEKDDKMGGDKCIAAQDFKVLKTSSGRDALVGTLSQKDDAYIVTGDDGKVHSLANVPDGLKAHAGKKVIIDVKAMDAPATKSQTFKVVSYGSYP